MAQFNQEKHSVPCLVCGKPTYVRSVKEKAFCGRICKSEYMNKAKYYGMRSERLDKPKRAVGTL